MKNKTEEKKSYLPLGKKGYYGSYVTERDNEKSEAANKLIDEYNHKINSFDTEKENNEFARSIEDKINKIFFKEELQRQAAPEMYEALKEYIDYVERKMAQRTNTFYQHMKKALNKADGK